MTVEFNVLDDISAYYRYINGTVSWYYGYQTANHDYFDDEIHVGDMLYFCNHGIPWDQSKARAWGALRVVVDTPVQATDYEYVWEYFAGTSNIAYIDDTTYWKPLPNLNDPSNGLTVSGTHEITFDIPDDWKPIVYTYQGTTRHYYLGGFVIRLRVTNVSSSTEGGAQGGENIQHRNYAITIRDGSSYQVSDLYSAFPSVFEKTFNAYKLNANLVIENGELQIRSEEQLLIYNWDINLWSDGKLTIYGLLDWYPRFISGRYNYWAGELSILNGDFIFRRGGYTALTIAAKCNIKNAILEQLSYNNTIYFHAKSSGTISDTSLAFYSNYFYSALLNLSNMKIIPNDYISSPYQILAGTANFHPTVTGFDWSGVQKVVSTQGAFFKMVNPINTDTSKIALGTTYSKYSNYLTIVYLAKIRVVDEAGDPVEGARLYIYDKNGDSMLWHDWARTDGYVLKGLITYSDIDGYVNKYTSDYTSYVGQIPPWMTVGTEFWLRWEKLRVTYIGSGGYIKVDRRVGGNGLLCGYATEPIRTLEPYILSDADGWFKFSGEYGSFYPELFVYYKAIDKDGTTAEYDANPITIIVAKTGYEPVRIPLTVDSEVSLVITLKRSSVTPDLEVMPA